jgi:hypothetical protein
VKAGVHRSKGSADRVGPNRLLDRHIPSRLSVITSYGAFWPKVKEDLQTQDAWSWSEQALVPTELFQRGLQNPKREPRTLLGKYRGRRPVHSLRKSMDGSTMRDRPYYLCRSLPPELCRAVSPGPSAELLGQNHAAPPCALRLGCGVGRTGMS